MTTQTLKAGTRIEMLGSPAMGGFPVVPPESARIGRWLTRISGEHKNHVHGNGGWHVVVFNDGGSLLAHESRFRITSNIAA